MCDDTSILKQPKETELLIKLRVIRSSERSWLLYFCIDS
jgi:hypothetical protein